MPGEVDETLRKRLGGKNERVELVIQRGETFWRLSEIKYDGRHPIAAIFQLNNLTPDVAYENGLRRLIDPIYYAGKTYVLPAWSEVEELEKLFFERLDEKHPQLEPSLDSADFSVEQFDSDKRSYVTINWDQALYVVAQKKYGCDESIDEVVDAIYEINRMMPVVTNGSNGKSLVEPKYPGGKTFWLPARNEIPSLTMKYRERVKNLLK